MRALLVILLFAFTLSSCETIKGVGRDIENAGEAIEDAVDG
ncbi:MAG: entericidin A/B family lipoprotein [bacterium]